MPSARQLSMHGSFVFGEKKAQISANRPTWFGSDPTVRMSEQYLRKWARLIHPCRSLSVARRIRLGKTQVQGDEDRLTSVISWVKCELDYPGSRWAPQWDFRDARKEHLSFHKPNRDF